MSTTQSNESTTPFSSTAPFLQASQTSSSSKHSKSLFKKLSSSKYTSTPASKLASSSPSSKPDAKSEEESSPKSKSKAPASSSAGLDKDFATLDALMNKYGTGFTASPMAGRGF